MEFGAATATLPKKLSSGYGVAGRSAYDGVFTAPVKLRAPSFSTRFDDYREIFGAGGGGGGSLGSSIPILELPELNEERSKINEVRRSQLDYSAVFGGFRNLDGAVRFDELAAEPRKKKQQDSFASGASTRSKTNRDDQSYKGDTTNYSKEIPAVSRSSNDGKMINMSYHKVNQGSEDGTKGTTHIAHPIPAYTCLVEEVNPVKINRANKSTPAAQDAYSSNHHYNEGTKEVGYRTGASSDIAKKQSSNNGVKVKNRSSSVDLFFYACETSSGSNGAHRIKVPPSDHISGDSSNLDAMRSAATKCQTSKSDSPTGASRADSPSYLDDLVDSNSEAAASVAALRKAIEEAQLRLKVAKESLRRKKGFPDRVKRKSNIDLKANVKKEAEVQYKTMKMEEIRMRQTFGETDALPQVSSEVGRPMRKERVRSDAGAKEMFVSAHEAQKKLHSTKTKRLEEVEHKEADHNAKVVEPKEAEISKKLPHNKNTDHDYEKPEESGHTIEVVKGYREQEKVRVGDEACAGEELACETRHSNQLKIAAANRASLHKEHVNETKHRCQEVIDETKLVQVAFDSGARDKKLKVNEDGEADNMVTPVHDPEDLECNLDEQGLITRNEKQVAFKPDDDGKMEEAFPEVEECKQNVRAVEQLSEIEKAIEENAELSDEQEELFWQKDNTIAFSPHVSYLESVVGDIQNSACLEDRKNMDEAGFLEKSIDTEDSCQRQGTENNCSNIIVQEIQEEIVDNVLDEEEIFERVSKNNDLDEEERVQDTITREDELEGGFILVEETEREMEDNKESVDITRVAQIDPNYMETKAKEARAGKSTETSSSNELNETEKLNDIQVADTIIENDEAFKVTPVVYPYDVQDDIMVAHDASFQQDKDEEPESVKARSSSLEEHAAETSVSNQDVLELNEGVTKMQGASATVICEGADTNIGETDMKCRQNDDKCLESTENDCNLASHDEETTAEPVEFCIDTKEAKVTSDEEVHENRSKFSNEENLFDYTEVCEIPTMSELKSSGEEEVETIQSSPQEIHQAPVTMEAEETKANPQKLELEKEDLKKIDEGKERERVRRREREKEKLAVERAIREARERAFADARERAALERAAAEARKNIDVRERPGKTTGQANEKTLAEKAAMEVKLKAERAAVERATAEARARALERALSEKAASEARNKHDKSDQYSGASRDNGAKQNFQSKSFSYGVRDSIDLYDGASGDSAQRCKARSERHQRIGDRVAKALAEKNMRDRLVQKEQEERNRIAEALDADVKRWSSGKTGNLRALLSTLQYILGPESGWQPIPLTDIVATSAVKKAYRKATLFVHPDKLQQRGASIQQKYICEKVFDLLKESWNRFNMEER
ncbi:auxilin-like protein 1 [Arachis duranensis]|uniref:Auxilin-like protein 1 n=1 Tax=Arachis duranensis TaxID=130453 RepID=A0A6P4DRC8_ARADU|nr:auxilin-like protein 1 [Arachis duranensis]